MKFKDYINTYLLTKNINRYRKSRQEEMAGDGNEFDENYYRVDDKPNDGRGSF